MSRCVFVTVGTTRFDRLIETIFDEQSHVLATLEECFDMDKLIVQTGRSSMPAVPERLAIESYSYKDSISNDIEQADLVISHAGAGTILQSLEAGKPLLVVVNENLMDNHQLEIADQMEKEGYLCHCTCSNLSDGLRKLARQSFKKYQKGNPALFGRYLNEIVLR